MSSPWDDLPDKGPPMKSDREKDFEAWCAEHQIEPNEFLFGVYLAGYMECKKQLGNPAPYTLQLAPYTQSYLKVHNERDELREENAELLKHLNKANRVNAKMTKLLVAAQDLAEEYGNG